MKLVYICFFLFLAVTFQSQILSDCSQCSIKLIKTAQIKGLSIDEIRLLKNEIFARNSYQFENGRFQNFFESNSGINPEVIITK